ncbi:hypothetical protein DFR48_10110 [Ciceribacter lividus]|uniref:Uncharacterized protein n=1 Tax=Ciceribacter lividus TaxID=1197950 RepID=A0A6I7HSP8_9HYPH|nr:hypothetical protein [Ciceribacter lividus]RCW28002.1 hypothetical protein DFR48_10110 [Ciceribacter lividus]
MKRAAILWREHRLLLLAFLATSALALFFAARFAFYVVYWNAPEHRNQPIETWMTIGYIARSYDLPREALADALGVGPLGTGRRPTVEQLARDRGMSPEEFRAEIERAIAKLREGGPVR